MNEYEFPSGGGLAIAGVLAVFTIPAVIAAACLTFTARLFAQFNATLPRMFEVFDGTTVTILWFAVVLLEGWVWLCGDDAWRPVIGWGLAIVSGASFLLLALAALAPWGRFDGGLV